jgi:monoamine oxidase
MVEIIVLGAGVAGLAAARRLSATGCNVTLVQARDRGIGAATRLADPVERTLFFAGEATQERLAGTVGGALDSGYRAAEEILATKIAKVAQGTRKSRR